MGSRFDFCPRNSRLAMHNLSWKEKITIIQIDLDVSAVKRIETSWKDLGLEGTSNATEERKKNREWNSEQEIIKWNSNQKRKVNRSSSKFCLHLHVMSFLCSWSPPSQVLNRLDKALGFSNRVTVLLQCHYKAYQPQGLHAAWKNMPKFLIVFRTNNMNHIHMSVPVLFFFSGYDGGGEQLTLYSYMGILAQWRMRPYELPDGLKILILNTEERVVRFVSVTLVEKNLNLILRESKLFPLKSAKRPVSWDAWKAVEDKYTVRGLDRGLALTGGRTR